MTPVAAYAISLSLNLEAARCPCDLERQDFSPQQGLCPQCECLCALADAVLAYDDRCVLQQNREVRGVID